MENNRKVFRVTLAAEDAAAFLEHCEQAEWFAIDTGERIMTDDGPDSEVVLLVEPAPRTDASTRVALVH